MLAGKTKNAADAAGGKRMIMWKMAHSIALLTAVKCMALTEAQCDLEIARLRPLYWEAMKADKAAFEAEAVCGATIDDDAYAQSKAETEATFAVVCGKKRPISCFSKWWKLTAGMDSRFLGVTFEKF